MEEFWSKSEQIQFAQRMEDEHTRQNHRISNIENGNMK